MTDRMMGHAKPLADCVGTKVRGDFPDSFLTHACNMTNNLSDGKTGSGWFRQISCHGKHDAMATDEKPFGDIAERLVWHRTLENLTQNQYAAKIGVTRSTLNNWESGQFRLSLDGALALRKTYGLSLDFMYEGIDDALPMTLRRAWRERP